MKKAQVVQHEMRNMNFTQYMLKYGIRTAQQIIDPKLRDQSVFALPQHSVYHHLDYTGISLGPAASHFVFAGYTKSIYFANVTELTSHEGMPRKAITNTSSLEREIKSKNLRLRTAVDISAVVRDGNTLLMFNYNLIARIYRYTRSTFATYYAWYNTFSTMVDKMVEVANITDNHQFMLAYVPSMVPSKTQFDKAALRFDNAALAVFKEPKAFMALDMWKWLGENRQSSILSKIPEKKLKLINLVFVENGKWTILNLGFLNSFRRPDDQKKWESEELGENAGLSPSDVQKRFLMMLMGVMSARTVIAVDESDVQGAHIDKIAQDELMKSGDEHNAVQDVIAEQIDEDADERVETEAEKAIRIEQENKHIDSTLSQLEEIGARQEEGETQAPTVSEVLQAKAGDHMDMVQSRLDTLADQNILTAAEYKRMMAIAAKVKTIPAPDGSASLDDYRKVNLNDLAIDYTKDQYVDNVAVVDKSMLKSSIQDFDEVYQKKALDKHIAAMCVQLNRGGYLVTDYKVETNASALGVEKNYALSIQPIEGAPSTIRFKLPVLNKDGSFTTNGTNYRLSKQFGDIPIRKISPEEVALSSYYGKCFVQRGRKNAYNATNWYQNQITAQALDESGASTIKTIIPGNVFDKDKAYPKDYTAIAQNFKSIETAETNHYFSLEEASSVFGKEVVNTYYKNGSCVLAVTKKGVIYIDKENAVCLDDSDGTHVLGPVYDYFKLDGAPPIEFAELSVFGQSIPLGLIFGYYIGLSALIKMLGAEVQRYQTGTRFQFDDNNDFKLTFEDETLVFSRSNRLAVLILGGFTEYHKALKTYGCHNFDQRAVYANVLESKQIAVRYLRELEQMDSYFIDPITHDILEYMKEPTTWQGLLVRAAQLLLDDKHYHEIDMRGMRIKGNERIAGAVYTELMSSIRAHHGQMGKSNKKVEMNPYAVWNLVTQDPAKFQLSEINPVKNLKEREALTFAGEGGRSKDSLTRDTRFFHPTHMGIVSEATKDSSDVGVNVFLSPNAKLTNAYGMVEMYDQKKDGIASVISTAALLAPGSDGDDQKRVGFVGIQMEHVIAAVGYHQPTIRTGYEHVIGQRQDERYCLVARQPGVVKSMNETGLIVLYDGDKEETGIQIGRYYGTAAGLVVPHQVIAHVKVGQKFKVGDCLVYNTGFYEPDMLEPSKVIYKTAMDVTTVLWESTQTLEDASSISPRLAERSTTTITKMKSIVVNFTDEISKLIDVGAKTEFDTPLCYISDSVVGTSGAFDEETMDSLAMLKSQTPRAGVKGQVERIEVYYHGDIEDMSESLQKITIKSDKEMKQRAQGSKKPVYTGQVDAGFRNDGTPLGYNEVTIRIYITSHVNSGLGDKGAFCNQLKTIVSEVMPGDYKTESGELIDAIFGYKSIDARIVTSSNRIGLASTILRHISQDAADAYFK